MASSLQGYSFRTFTSWFASHMARTSTIYVHHRILTHHECGCKICCWARRAQNPPGWRASLSELTPEVGAGRPPSWKTRTINPVTRTKTNWASKFIYSHSQWEFGSGVFLVFGFLSKHPIKQHSWCLKSSEQEGLLGLGHHPPHRRNKPSKKPSAVQVRGRWSHRG